MRLLLVALIMAVFCSCSASNPDSPKIATPSVERAAGETPVESFGALVAALNAHDAAGVYALLSAEAKTELSSEQAGELVVRLASADPDYRISITVAGAPVSNGEQAQFDLTLDIFYQGKHFPLSDVAFMKLEDGQWRLSDHFLQTALAAGGVAPPPAKPRVFRADGCVEGNVLEGVYLPSRLQVLEPCVTAEGIVREVERSGDGESDGDLSFDVAVSRSDERLLNDGNRRNMHGWLHMEIVPLDRSGLHEPVEGEHIRRYGPVGARRRARPSRDPPGVVADGVAIAHA
jgi:hypothetical protein